MSIFLQTRESRINQFYKIPDLSDKIDSQSKGRLFFIKILERQDTDKEYCGGNSYCYNPTIWALSG